MSYIVRIYYSDRIYSVDLSLSDRASIGNGHDDTVRFDAYGLTRGHIRFVKKRDGWVIKAKKNLYRENSLISSEKIFEGASYTIPAEPPVFVTVHPKQSDGEKIVRMEFNNSVDIGRDKNNDIVFSSMRASSKHCRIYKVNDELKIKDCGSRNGTFVNGRKITEKILNDGDIINIAVYHIVFEKNALYFFNIGNDATFNIPTSEKDEDAYIYGEDLGEAGKNRSKTFSLFG